MSSSSCVSKNTYIGFMSNVRLIGLPTVVVVGGVFYNGEIGIASLFVISRRRAANSAITITYSYY